MHDTDLGPGRPDADECLPYYFQYIELVPDGDVVGLLERQIAESAAFLAAFTAEQALWREAPGEWNTVEIVGHLADTERVFEYRALRIARADPVMWTQVEFPDYAAAANFQARPLGDVVSEYAAVRVAFVAFLRGLDADSLGSGGRRRTGPSAACAPSPTPWPVTSSITWPTSVGSTAG